jgi:hypothetical protein
VGEVRRAGCLKGWHGEIGGSCCIWRAETSKGCLGGLELHIRLPVLPRNLEDAVHGLSPTSSVRLTIPIAV